MNLSFAQQKVLHWLGFALLFSGAVAGIVVLQQNNLAVQRTILSPEAYQRQENQEKLQVNLLRYLPSFGFDNLIGNWLYLRFIQYFGDTPAREAVGYGLSSDYFQALVDRDPRFVDAILKLESSTSIFAGKPQDSIRSLNQSLSQVNPQQTVFTYPPYYLWLYKGIDELLFLGDVEAAKQSYTKAIAWAEKSDFEGSQQTVQNLKGTLQFLAQNPKSKIPQIGAWSMVLSGTSDARTQQRAIAEIKALGGEVQSTPDGRMMIHVPEGIN